MANITKQEIKELNTIPDIQDKEEAKTILAVEQARLTQVKRMKLEGTLLDKAETLRDWKRGLKAMRSQMCSKCQKVIDEVINNVPS